MLIHWRAHPFYSFFQFVINEEREVLGRARVEVKEVLKVASNSLFEEPVIIEGLLKETVETRLEVQQTLQERRQGDRMNRDNIALAVA